MTSQPPYGTTPDPWAIQPDASQPATPGGQSPTQGSHPSVQNGPTSPQGGYPTAQSSYPSTQGGYPPAQGGYPQTPSGYPHSGPGWNQPGYVAPEPSPSDPAKYRLGKIMLWSSAGLLLLGLAVMALGITSFVRGISAIESNKATLASGYGSVQLDAGDKRTIWSRSPTNAVCEVRGPSGPVEVNPTNVTASLNSRDYHGVASFTANQAGRYRVSCDASDDFRGFIGGHFGGSSIVGFVGGLAGGILCVISAAFLLIFGLRMKRHHQPPS